MQARRWMVVLALVVLGAWLLVVPVSAAVMPVSLAATLKGGANQKPPGDPDGSGNAYVTIAPGKVCYTIRVQGIQLPATEAHIHKGAKGVSGPVVVPFNKPPDQSGITGGCTAVKPTLSKQIQNNPANYYVNIHNKDFPEGAIRGQLQKQ